MTNEHPITPATQTTPATSLVEMLVDAITDSAAAYGTADEPARAAILAVADWLRQRNVRVRASLEIAGDLEQEANQ